MNAEEVVAELTRAAEQLGVEVRSRSLRGSRPSAGGLCKIRGQNVVLLNSHATPFERSSVLAHALAELGYEPSAALLAETRRLLARHVKQTRPAPVPSKPGLAGLGAHGRRRRG